MKVKLIGLILVASGTLFLTSCGGAEPEEKVEEVSLKPLVTLSNVELKAFHHDIRVQGNVETDQDVTLSAEMGGLITSINVKEGQKVHKGQVIARVDASVLASNVSELQTKLEYAEYMLGKQEELHKRGVGSEFDLETAKSQVNSIKASMHSLNTQRGRAVIKAPFTGIVDQVFARKGQVAGPASPLVRIVNNKDIDIVATVSEKHFINIRVGTPIQVSFPNYSDTVMNLEITNVGNYIEAANRTFRVRSKIKNNDFFLPNMLAEVSITDFSVDKGMVIPSVSILKDRANKDFVYVADDIDSTENHYKVRMVYVEVINKFEGEALITTSEKFDETTSIVVEGAKGIANDDIVRIKDTTKK
ncbi:MAG: membrane fusion protein (multidrug efflux system) [Flavobacteriaceae bacterium]|jgi:membrane fusion protein (multidrug efflux system)